MSYAGLIVMVLVAVPSMVLGDTVEIQWQINVLGTGPGIETVTKNLFYRHVPCEGCSIAAGKPAFCATDPAETNIIPDYVFDNVTAPGWKSCGFAQFSVGVTLRDVVPGPASLSWAYSHPSLAITTVMKGLTSGPAVACGAGAGVGTWSGTATGGTISVVSSFLFGLSTGQLSCFTLSPVGSCQPQGIFNNTCKGPPDNWELNATYRKVSTNLPKTCIELGLAPVPTDGAWHHVASATCMVGPDTATAWEGSAQLTGTSTGSKIESVMIAAGVNPNTSTTPYPAGPDLWVNISRGCSGCAMPVARQLQCQAPWGSTHLDCINQYSKATLPPDCKTFNESVKLVWGNLLKGNVTKPLGCLSDTFCMSGCLITSLGMILGLSPEVVNKQATCSGDMDPFTGALKSYDGLINGLGLKIPFESGNVTDEAIVAGLCRGQYILIKVTKTVKEKPLKHFFVITNQESSSINGEEKCRLRIADPAAKRGYQFLDEYDAAGWTRAYFFCLSR